jgi:uncharacterized protein YndB with AHSA1/START domain
MSTETVLVSEVIPATRERLYAAWLDSEQHSAFTADVADIEPFVGGIHSAFSGYVTGQVLALEPNRKIVASWRSTEFPDEAEDSRLEVTFEDTSGGTMITLLHTGIPSGQSDRCRDGWLQFYLAGMKKYFSGEDRAGDDDELTNGFRDTSGRDGEPTRKAAAFEDDDEEDSFETTETTVAVPPPLPPPRAKTKPPAPPPAKAAKPAARPAKPTAAPAKAAARANPATRTAAARPKAASARAKAAPTRAKTAPTRAKAAPTRAKAAPTRAKTAPTRAKAAAGRARPGAKSKPAVGKGKAVKAKALPPRRPAKAAKKGAKAAKAPRTRSRR